MGKKGENTKSTRRKEQEDSNQTTTVVTRGAFPSELSNERLSLDTWIKISTHKNGIGQQVGI